MIHHPDRTRRLQGATNFRDLGGYPGHGGRTVRWGRLFRSDHLAALTPADRAALQSLGVADAFDFRGVRERAAAPYELSGLRQHSLPIEPTVVQRMKDMVNAGQPMTAPVAIGLMESLYRGLIDEHAASFSPLFEHLLDTDAPLVFHCTAGKDRTGVAAALILLALGVSRDLVIQDYMLTNKVYEHPHLTDSRTPAEALAVLWRVDESFLHAALHQVDAVHGGVQAYLRQRIGLSDAALRALGDRYLQP